MTIIVIIVMAIMKTMTILVIIAIVVLIVIIVVIVTAPSYTTEMYTYKANYVYVALVNALIIVNISVIMFKLLLLIINSCYYYAEAHRIHDRSVYIATNTCLQHLIKNRYTVF